MHLSRRGQIEIAIVFLRRTIRSSQPNRKFLKLEIKMEIVVSIVIFCVVWFVLQQLFVSIFNRRMSSAESIIYPVILILCGAAIIGKMRPTGKEGLAKDIREYDRLSGRLAKEQGRDRQIQQCLQLAVVSRTNKTYQDCEAEVGR